jgi:hypothetical protein
MTVYLERLKKSRHENVDNFCYETAENPVDCLLKRGYKFRGSQFFTFKAYAAVIHNDKWCVCVCPSQILKCVIM